jgi:hypothetical protein
MNAFEALEVRPDMIFVHVATILHDATKKEEVEEAKGSQEIYEYGEYKAPTTSKSSNNLVEEHIGGLLPGQSILPSSISKVTVLSTNTQIPPQRRFKVEMRDKESQKVSLALYREESKKIFEILRGFS